MHQASDPGADDCGHTADQPEYRQATKRRRIFRDRHDDSQPFGDVLDDEADDEKRPQRRRSDRVGSADRQAFAQVVEADSDCDDGGERHARARFTLLGDTLLASNRIEQQPCADDSNPDDGDALERITQFTSQLERFSDRIDAEEEEEADGGGHEEEHYAGAY